MYVGFLKLQLHNYAASKNNWLGPNTRPKTIFLTGPARLWGTSAMPIKYGATYRNRGTKTKTGGPPSTKLKMTKSNLHMMPLAQFIGLLLKYFHIYYHI